MSSIRTAYLAAARSAAALLADPAVASRWAGPSALAEFRVSGLAGHLAGQLFRVRELLARPAPAGEPISLLDHYGRSAWVGAALDDEANTSVRRTGEELAADGADALVARAADTIEHLTAALPAEPPDRVVYVPWGPWSLVLDDFLTSRLLEIAIHSDDLAVSVGVAPPTLPDEVIDPVLSLLTRLAARRHGPTAVLRALSRAERAPTTVAAI